MNAIEALFRILAGILMSSLVLAICAPFLGYGLVTGGWDGNLGL